jgi:hypothetical protein
MLRGFTDSTGLEWRVWEVFPSRAPRPGADTFSRTSLKDSPFENGWLCFESNTAKRRLAPIPAGWEFAPVHQLEQLCRQAEVVPVRRRAHQPSESNAAPGAA